MSEERWPLPQNWRWTEAGEIADVVGGGTPSAKDPDNFAETGIPWLTPADLTGYSRVYIERGARDLSEKGYKTSSATLMPKGAILYSSRAPIGYCAIAANPISTNQGFKSLVPASEVSPEFVRLYLLASKEYAESKSSGTTFKELSGSRMAKLAVPLPPLPEQRRIVAKLDRLSTRSRAARDHLARTATLAARAKQAILVAAFRGDLTAEWRERTNPPAISADPTKIDNRARLIDALPPAWGWAALTSLAEVAGGLTKNQKRAAMPMQMPYLRVANVYANELRLSEVLDIGCTATEADKARLQNGDLLVVEGNGSRDQIGRVAIWRAEIDECLHQNHLIRVRPSPEVLPEFALYWLLSPPGRNAIEAVASSSSGLHTLSITKVKGLPVPACALDEQREIVRRIETAFARIDRLTAEAARAAQLLNRLDERLLAKAFRGELVPQDPADEPAEALLARIRAARAAAPRPKRGRRRKTA
ncbi:MAG: restriction endonuclease subunit S [Bacteroidota bacterium]